MAKFCKFCGTPLEEGQVCTCQASQSAVATEAAPAAAPVAAPGLFTKLKDAFLSYLRTPAATVRGAVNEDIKIPAILAGANALAAFLFLWKLLGGIFGSIVDAANKAMSGLGNLMGGSSGSLKIEITYPFFLLLLGGILLAALFIGLSALGLFCAAKLSKKELTIQQSFTVASYNSIIPTLLLVLGILLGFISLTAQLIVLAVAAILWAIFAVQDAREYAGLNPTIATKNLVIATVLMLVVAGLSIYLAFEIGLWCTGEIEIAGAKIGDAIDALKDFDITDLLGGSFF